MSDLERLLDLQSGVVTRAQLTEHATAAHGVRRMLRRRELAEVSRGVYVNHTGELTWSQRSWSAVLAVAPAALCHGSAIRAAEGPGRRSHDPDGVVHVAVDRARSPDAPPGVRLHHLADLDSKVLWNATPPRVRIEEALVDVAAEAPDDLQAIARLADAVQARMTTTDRLLAALAGRSRIPRRTFLVAAINDIGQGTCSALEHGYLTCVERPHGLPTGHRQLLGAGRHPVYRDVEYRDQGLRVELDGRAFHDSALGRDGDLERDLNSHLDGRSTVRLGWGQVFGRSCDTAGKVGALLQQRGWAGRVLACPRCAVPSLEGLAGWSG